MHYLPGTIFCTPGRHTPTRHQQCRREMGHLRAWGADGGLGIGLGVQMGNMLLHGEAAGSGSRTAPEPTTSGLAVRKKSGKDGDEWTRMVLVQNSSCHTFTHIPLDG